MTSKPCTHGVVAVTFFSSERFNGMKTVRQCHTGHRFWTASHSKRCPLLERNCTRHSEKKSVREGHWQTFVLLFCFPAREVSGRVSCTRFRNLVILGNTGHLSIRVGWSVNLAWDTGKGLHTCFTMPRFFYSVVWKKHWSLPITNTGSGWSGPAVPTIGCWSGPIPDRPILRSISFRLPAHSW